MIDPLRATGARQCPARQAGSTRDIVLSVPDGTWTARVRDFDDEHVDRGLTTCQNFGNDNLSIELVEPGQPVTATGIGANSRSASVNVDRPCGAGSA